MLNVKITSIIKDVYHLKKAELHWHGTTGHFHNISSSNLEVLTFPISKNTFCDVINQEMSRDTYKDFHLIRKVKQLLTETGMVGKSYFNHRKRKVSKISARGRLRKNNQALSYLNSSLREV